MYRAMDDGCGGDIEGISIGKKQYATVSIRQVLMSKIVLKIDGKSFIKGECIGNGGSSHVYKCYEQRSKKEYALKILNKEANNQQIRRFQQEITIQKDKALKKYLVPCLYDGVVDGLHCYVMPYYEHTLRNLIKSNTATMMEKAFWFMDVCKALQGVRHIHNDFVHRDLKPENIFFDGKHLLLGDCGIAHLDRSNITVKGERLANRNYCSPEQRFDSNLDPTHEMDIYALGMILNELFTGKTPLGHKYTKISDIYPPFEFLDDLVDSMMEWESSERKNIDAVVSILKCDLTDFKSRFAKWKRANPKPERLSEDEYEHILNASYEDLILAEGLINNPDTDWYNINCDYHNNILYNAERFYDFVVLMEAYGIVMKKANYEGSQRFLNDRYHDPPSENEDTSPWYDLFDEFLCNIKTARRPHFGPYSVQDMKGICEKQFRSLNNYHLKEIFYVLKPKRVSENLISSPIMRVSISVQSAYNECRALGATNPFTFGNHLKICWEGSSADCLDNNLHRPLFKTKDDYANEEAVIRFLHERYSSLIIDRVGEDYRFFFTMADYSDFKDWCNSSVGGNIEFWVPEEILKNAKAYGDIVKVSLYDTYVYSHLYRILTNKTTGKRKQKGKS